MGETLTMKRILVADHSEIANRMFCAGLSKYGFSVSAVSTTEELIHKCTTEEIDMLLLDLYLEQTSQMDQIHYLRELCPEMYLIVMSDEPDISSAVQTMKKYEHRLKNAEGMRAVDQIVTEFVTEANNSICDMLREKNCLSGGTTFAMLYFIDGLAKLYYLGDSRIYMQDEEDLICLTRDHTLANQKLDAGIYTEAQAKKSADQHRLTLYVGVDKNGLGLNADSRPPVALQPGRKFLLCTDGLVDMCSEQEIQDILSQDYFNEAAVLVQTAVNYGGIDNVTCIVLEVIPIEEPAELESDPML